LVEGSREYNFQDHSFGFQVAPENGATLPAADATDLRAHQRAEILGQQSPSPSPTGLNSYVSDAICGVAPPKIWNELPTEVRSASALENIKMWLKTFSFTRSSNF
jgi:hypothetical protein